MCSLKSSAQLNYGTNHIGNYQRVRYELESASKGLNASSAVQGLGLICLTGALVTENPNKSKYLAYSGGAMFIVSLLINKSANNHLRKAGVFIEGNYVKVNLN